MGSMMMERKRVIFDRWEWAGIITDVVIIVWRLGQKLVLIPKLLLICDFGDKNHRLSRNLASSNGVRYELTGTFSSHSTGFNVDMFISPSQCTHSLVYKWLDYTE